MLKKNKKLNFNIKKVDAFFFDFDVVLTNNLVIINENGSESVICNRSDGLGFNFLNKICTNIYILSSEKNPVVKNRAKKLKVKCYQGLTNKLDTLKLISKKTGIDLKKSVYVGNDLNDYDAMKECKIKICPKDSHKKIISIADFLLKKKGGDGVVIELIESVFKEQLSLS